MHLHKLTILLVVSLISCQSAYKLPKSYDVTPVMLHLAANKQSDSVGFNLVRAIPELLYPKLLTGDLALWVDSDKKTVVGSQQFSQLERRAVNPFVSGDDLFIHEYWQIFKKNFNFGIQGFSFLGKDKSGKAINYGYVDINDIINLLKTELIPCNASGSANLTYWDALQTKTYQFNLIQFGNNDFKTSPKLSSALQYQALHSPDIHRKLAKVEPTKTIVYKILSPSINSNPENKTFYTILTEYVNNNKQTILNASKSDYFQSILFVPWKIDNVTVTESWSKYKHIPFQELKEVELFIEKHAIILNAKQLEELGVRINLQILEEYLSEKRFGFLLEKINNQEIQPQQSEAYYAALNTKPWNKIRP
jgi:hypothetical protein